VIKPTIGRVVWYHPPFVPDSGSNEQTFAAIVCCVWSDTCVNLAVFDSNGVVSSQTSVNLWQFDSDISRPASGYAEWMPYQQGQAAKTEQLEKILSIQPNSIDDPPKPGQPPPIGQPPPPGPIPADEPEPAESAE
jgi:hypothetical protein